MAEQGRTAEAARPAGFVSRAVAFGIDLVAIGLEWKLATAVIHVLMEVVIGAHTSGVDWLRALVPRRVLTFLFTLAYFTLAWRLFGQTIGMLLLGLRVERGDGRRVGWGTSVLRFFGYTLSALPFGLGFLWVLWDPKREALHDKLARTRVVYVPRPKRVMKVRLEGAAAAEREAGPPNRATPLRPSSARD